MGHISRTAPRRFRYLPLHPRHKHRETTDRSTSRRCILLSVLERLHVLLHFPPLQTVENFGNGSSIGQL